MDRKVIKARRKAIDADARCDGCGATLAFCKSQRGRDTTAPPWFGCCAQGIDMRPCNHVPDYRAYRALVKEIERGEVRDPDEMLLAEIEEFPLFSPGRRGRSMRARVLAMAAESWPDDVPMPGHF